MLPTFTHRLKEIGLFFDGTDAVHQTMKRVTSDREPSSSSFSGCPEGTPFDGQNASFRKAAKRRLSDRIALLREMKPPLSRAREGDAKLAGGAQAGFHLLGPHGFAEQESLQGVAADLDEIIPHSRRLHAFGNHALAQAGRQ